VSRACAALALAALALPAGLRAEPMFLSKQYNRCTSCHYSPTGGGLLTPYGRSLSRQELSTWGRSDPGAPPPAKGKGEEAFLWGALGDRLAPLELGFDVRPSHLGLDVGGPTSNGRDLLMTADLLAAWAAHGFTAYAELGRKPAIGEESAGLYSYEYWAGYESHQGLGLRVGRFFPAYGIRLADHTAFNRSTLGFDKYDQVYALELSRRTDRHLLQVSIGPGYADSIVHSQGRDSFTASGRFQLDLNSHTSLVLSGLFRDKTALLASNGSFGVGLALGPTRRLSILSEADVQLEKGRGGAPAYVLINETGFEVVRGVWLKFSPQLRTEYGDTSSGVFRLAFEADLLPRTHWNLDVSYYHDKYRGLGYNYDTLLAQLHLYI
jgi:hypothetical protein